MPPSVRERQGIRRSDSHRPDRRRACGGAPEVPLGTLVAKGGIDESSLRVGAWKGGMGAHRLPGVGPCPRRGPACECQCVLAHRFVGGIGERSDLASPSVCRAHFRSSFASIVGLGACVLRVCVVDLNEPPEQCLARRMPDASSARPCSAYRFQQISGTTTSHSSTTGGL